MRELIMRLVEFMHLENLKLYRKQLESATNEVLRKQLLTLLTEELVSDQKYPNANIGAPFGVHPRFIRTAAVTVMAGALLASTPTFADPLAYGAPLQSSHRAVEQIAPYSKAAADASEVPTHLRRQIVQYSTREAAGTIVIDTANTYLYFVLGQGRAIRYGIGVGREGFTWSGTQSIARKQEWPDWYPPEEMIERQPYLPRMMAGGVGNPLGARAMYLGNTVYRIHGTNAPDTIGQRVSSGCIRLLNDDVSDLFDRVNVGTKVVVVLSVNSYSTPDVAIRHQSVPQRVRATFADHSGAHGLY
jgi:lipoprotein-anchoring transpeptidase ErfK/SrfK